LQAAARELEVADFDTDARICEQCATEDADLVHLSMRMEELPDGTWEVDVEEVADPRDDAEPGGE